MVLNYYSQRKIMVTSINNVTTAHNCKVSEYKRITMISINMNASCAVVIRGQSNLIQVAKSFCPPERQAECG